ncbi:MAG: hypothetical protein NXI24_18805 [bacterium]|nr:hypothetical protein [bacterium]
MITRYRKRYRKLGRWIHRATLSLGTLLFLGLLGSLVFIGVQAFEGTVRNPVPMMALLSASLVTPFLVAGIFESILTRILHWRFRRYSPRMIRAGGGAV